MWLFDTLVTPSLLYVVETWEPSLCKENNWKGLEKTLVSMIPCMIKSKALMPHDIIQAEFEGALIITKALFQSVTNRELWELLNEGTE